MVSIAGVSEELSVVVLGLMTNLSVEHGVAWCNGSISMAMLRNMTTEKENSKRRARLLKEVTFLPEAGVAEKC